jgi:hypothetical protein
MPDWSIKIVASDSGAGAAFVPDLQGAKQGEPLQAWQDDLVTWNNTTGDPHQPWPTDAAYNPLQVQRGSANYLSDEIPPAESSRPSYDVAQPRPATGPPPDTWTVYYYCKVHPTVETERGTIVVTTVPTS